MTPSLKLSTVSLVLSAIFTAPTVLASSPNLPSFEQCLLQQMQHVDPETTVATIRQTCRDRERDTLLTDVMVSDQPKAPVQLGAISNRIVSERVTGFDPFVITPHRRNFILPVLTTNNINRGAYNEVLDWSDNLEELESKFQLSLKVPLNYSSMLVEGDGLFFAFTVEAWWQVYSDNISKPFRETNYRPEVFYLMPLDYHPFGGNTGLLLGVEHQSNGRGTLLSRSWNRAYAGVLYEQEDYFLFFKPYYRFQEDEDQFPGDPDGDDNPDISDFMGHFELGGGYKWDVFELDTKFRRNFGTSKGAIEVNLTFPLWGKLRGYATFFDGYGESLIDYNHSQTRFGLGMALNDIF